jgi:hypothetical protein
MMYLQTAKLNANVPGESSFTARAKTPIFNGFKILKKFRNVCRCRTVCKNVKFFNETGKYFVLIRSINLYNFSPRNI